MYKVLICYSVFFIGICVMGVVALALAWVRAIHHWQFVSSMYFDDICLFDDIYIYIG